MSTQKARRGHLVMTFAKDEKLPEPGETRIMRGGYGVSYAVTVHRIKKCTDTEKYVYLDVDATRRVVSIDDLEDEPA